MESALLGVALGLFAGMVPGPFLTLVVTTALRSGLEAGLKVALIPLGTELPVALVTVFVLTRLPYPALRWIGLAGGLLVLYMAWSVERDARHVTLEEGGTATPVRGHYLRVALVGVLAPAPWIFWFLIAGPLFLSRWNVSPLHAVGFLAAFFAAFVGTMALIAWGVATGREKLSDRWHRRALRGAGVVLAVAGCVLLWQSWVGNFSEIVDPQRRIQDAVGEVSHGTAARPGSGRPEVGQPGIGHPGAGRPEVGWPEVAALEISPAAAVSPERTPPARTPRPPDPTPRS